MVQQHARARPDLRLDSPVAAVPRVRTSETRLLSRLGVRTVRDLLLYLPADFERFDPTAIADLPASASASFVGTVVQIRAKRTRVKGMLLTEAVVADDEGSTLQVAWFNKPFVAQQLHPGDRVSLAGRVRTSRYGRQMQSPDYERVGEEGTPVRVGELMPKYRLTKGMTSPRLATLVRAVLPLAGDLEDDLPDAVRRRHGLLPLAEAVRLGHRPPSEEDWRRARRRMDFAALLELQAAFQLAQRRVALERATPIPYRQEVIDTFKAGLGFELTRAQRRATWEVYQDLRQSVPMNRLLNGDVGSGKTAVAAAAAAMAHAAGMQTVIMAPTEILARQHRDKLRAYLEGSFPDLKVELLISGLPAAERRRVRTAVASGHCALLVGTHALIEDDVELADLGLAVVDEQHRFGTRQRELLRAKSRAGRPHFLAMTATPIPRTLALALYGEMRLSIIDELPPGRTPVDTQVVPPTEREAAYDLVRREVRAGRQAFVICSLISPY